MLDFFFQLRKLGKLEPAEFFEKLGLGVSLFLTVCFKGLGHSRASKVQNGYNRSRTVITVLGSENVLGWLPPLWNNLRDLWVLGKVQDDSATDLGPWIIDF